MATAHDLIKRALRLVRALGTGETPSADQAADGLTALNALLDSWAISRLYVYTVIDTTKVLTAGTGSYTVGAGGSINMTRPEEVTNGCYVSDGATDYPTLGVLDDVSWSGISYKSQQSGPPQYIYLRQALPLATVYLWPVPDKAYTLHFMTWQRLQSFTALTDALTLPSGYEQAIVPSLAEVLAPEYGVPVSPEVAQMAMRARNALVPINAPRMRLGLSMDLSNAGLYRGRVGNIYSI